MSTHSTNGTDELRVQMKLEIYRNRRGEEGEGRREGREGVGKGNDFQDF